MAAPSFKSVGPYTHVPAGGAGTIAVPGGVVDGDMLLMFIQTATSSGGLGAVSIPGWTPLQTVNSGTFEGGLRALYRVAASEPASYTISVGNNSGNPSRAIIAVYSAAGINVSAVSATVSGTAQALPTLTTSVAPTLLVMYAAEINTRTLALNPPGTSSSRASEASGGYSSAIADEAIASAGAVGTRTFTTASNADLRLISVALTGTGGGSPPTLTSPTGNKTGTTTASGTVTTTETGGTLYYRATTNASESAATVKAGSSITVDALNESVSLTGLTAATTYYLHYLHTGANGDSAVVSSGTFTTDAATDSTPPTMNGSITVGAVAATSIQISWLAASDNVAVTSYETSTDGTTWTDRGNVLTYTFAGLTASTSYTLRVRAKDAAGNVAATPLQVTQSTAAAGARGTFTSGALSRNNGSPVVSTSLTWLTLLAESSGAFVTTKTNVAVNASGIFTVASDAAMTPGTAYRATWKEVTGEAGQGTAVAT